MDGKLDTAAKVGLVAMAIEVAVGLPVVIAADNHWLALMLLVIVILLTAMLPASSLQKDINREKAEKKMPYTSHVKAVMPRLRDGIKYNVPLHQILDNKDSDISCSYIFFHEFLPQGLKDGSITRQHFTLYEIEEHSDWGKYLISCTLVTINWRKRIVEDISYRTSLDE